ncbi:MAG: serine/threonine protein kinase, partial [Myxococcales bacterium]|nr:serine/threonine protein kinase [Myxococcales bacterium]
IREGRVQARVRHPHLVAVTDVLDLDGSPGLLMELAHGPALDEWLARYRPTLDEAVRVFRGIVLGVGYAHAQGLVHRDLKPANVLLHLDAGQVVPKVTDFGLAKLTESGDENRTRSGVTMGTPAYMPPEQIRNAAAVDRRADIYSLGCILYEMVTGEQAYRNDDMLALFNDIASGAHVPASERVEGLPEAILRTLSRTMA